MSRTRKAWRVSFKHGDGSDIAYGPTAGRVRADWWRCIVDCWPDARIVDVIVRRAAYADVILPDPDPLANNLDDEQRHCLMHAFGGNDDPIKAGYRDYFYTYRDDPPLLALTAHGLMEPMAGDAFGKNMTYFVLTDAGKRVALSLTPEYRK